MKARTGRVKRCNSRGLTNKKYDDSVQRSTFVAIGGEPHALMVNSNGLWTKVMGIQAPRRLTIEDCLRPTDLCVNLLSLRREHQCRLTASASALNGPCSAPP
jgi:hypothetical protein